jgi:hypothetical protein
LPSARGAVITTTADQCTDAPSPKSRRTTPEPLPLTAPERELIRRELCQHFGQDPRLADGFLLRTWRSGPQAGQPKLSPAVQSMLERGLVEIQTSRGPRGVFTPAGMAALRQLVSDCRAMDSARFAHLRRELGLDDGGSGVESSE